MSKSELHIYNTWSRKKEIFQPLEAGKINMYVCGLTTYDYCHIGHARMLVAFDIIVRHLRNSGYEVTYVRNITDIDDKILARAQENGEAFTSLTERFIKATHEDEMALGILPPDKEPRATAHIDQIIDMISVLVAREAAYRANNGDVYYSVRQFADYGKLSNKNPEELLAGARIEVDEDKRDPRDFALWKAAADGEVGWDSPWGYGRPGWHIECSAMSTCCLGNSFDIHGGGSDLMFPHHENEIAQSEAATGVKFARYWLHNGSVRVDNEKMSKSLGNFFTVREVLEKYPAEVVRYLLLASHYRSPINYSDQGLEQAAASLERFYAGLRPFDTAAARDIVNSRFEKAFKAAMNDDFNTPVALGVLFDLVREINRCKDAEPEVAADLARLLVKLGSTLGILQQSPEVFLQQTSREKPDAEIIKALIAERQQARADRDWALADQIRARLAAMNVVVEDSAKGSVWRIER
ncbi:MAG: cysteine--tRNA ligase [Pseudomonadales bacterium]|nr:cysteine--tRNA ligase [Pseudomonadales bacterium]